MTTSDYRHSAQLCYLKVGPARLPYVRASCSEVEDTLPQQGAKEKYAAVLMPQHQTSSGLMGQTIARPKVPANLVTSWSNSAAQRVLTCVTNQEPGLRSALSWAKHKVKIATSKAWLSVYWTAAISALCKSLLSCEKSLASEVFTIS